MNKLTDYIHQAVWPIHRWVVARAEARQRNKLISDGTLVVGSHTYGTPRIDTYKGSEARVIIGPYCSISRGVVLVTGGIHPTDWISLYPFRIKWDLPGAYRDGTPATKGDIVIGPDVWLGTDAMVLSGVTIGAGAVVAARSVVTSNVAPFTMVAGSPARTIKSRFSKDQIQSLLEIAWWNWSHEKVLQALPLLNSDRIDDFIKQYS